MKRIGKVSKQRNVTRLTPDLFFRIHEWEQNSQEPVRLVDIERMFHVNRSTYTRWKAKYFPLETKNTKKPNRKTKNNDNTNINAVCNSNAKPSDNETKSSTESSPNGENFHSNNAFVYNNIFDNNTNINDISYNYNNSRCQ